MESVAPEGAAGVSVDNQRSRHAVIFRIGGLLAAVPPRYVVEILRPLHVEGLPRMPACVVGVSVIRGRSTPVVDGRSLFSIAGAPPPTRWLALRVGERTVALAVDAVLGLHPIGAVELSALPPLLGGAGDGPVAEIGRMDADLLVVLDAGRIVPQELWSALEARGDAG